MLLPSRSKWRCERSGQARRSARTITALLGPQHPVSGPIAAPQHSSEKGHERPPALQKKLEKPSPQGQTCGLDRDRLSMQQWEIADATEGVHRGSARISPGKGNENVI
jgi:hypothetical protein